MAVGAESLIAPRIPRANTREHDPRLHGISAAAISSVLLWIICFAGYAWLGARIVTGEHLVVFDATARLAHAFFAYYDAPPKLAAIGFVWPPVSSLVFFPLAVIRPLASSLLALPLTSAAFAAGLVVVLNRTLVLLRVPWLARYALLAGFALNPMIVFYATNGMSEVVYLFFLMSGIHLLLRWYLSGDAHFLVLASVPFTLAVLTRYEILGFLIAATIIVIIVMRRPAVSAVKREAAMLGFLSPLVYGFGLWVFFNWLILRDPLFWLKNQAPGAGGQQAGQVAVHQAAGLDLPTIVSQVATVNVKLFPFAVAMLPVLLLVWFRRRDAMTGGLTMLLLVNAVTTIGLMTVSHAESFLQLRYNMRAIPVAIVAAGWAIHSLERPWPRRLAALAAAAGLALSLPVTWQAMKTYHFQYLENAFTQAITTGKNFDRQTAFGGYPVGTLQERQMAEYVRAHIRSTHAILTDDALSLEVMLISGHPERFLDRIDYGDTRWKQVLAYPFGQVRYLLISTYPQTVLDLIELRYPKLDRGESWAKVVLANDRYVLLSVPRCPPLGSNFTIPARCRRLASG